MVVVLYRLLQSPVDENGWWYRVFLIHHNSVLVYACVSLILVAFLSFFLNVSMIYKKPTKAEAVIAILFN